MLSSGNHNKLDMVWIRNPVSGKDFMQIDIQEEITSILYRKRYAIILPYLLIQGSQTWASRCPNEGSSHCSIKGKAEGKRCNVIGMITHCNQGWKGF